MKFFVPDFIYGPEWKSSSILLITTGGPGVAIRRDEEATWESAKELDSAVIDPGSAVSPHQRRIYLLQGLGYNRVTKAGSLQAYPKD